MGCSVRPVTPGPLRFAVTRCPGSCSRGITRPSPRGGSRRRSDSPGNAGPTCGRRSRPRSATMAARSPDAGNAQTREKEVPMGLELMEQVAREGLRTDIPKFDAGDTVKVMVRVKEGEKTRLQAFEGVVIARRGGGLGETFTVRKVSAGVGVERVFPLHGPVWASIEVVRRGRVRRAKLYYLRNLSGKRARIKEKRDR